VENAATARENHRGPRKTLGAPRQTHNTHFSANSFTNCTGKQRFLCTFPQETLMRQRWRISDGPIDAAMIFLQHHTSIGFAAIDIWQCQWNTLHGNDFEFPFEILNWDILYQEDHFKKQKFE